ncbi:MAG: PLP-dependent transferase [Prevotellaceae bacterium]|jgi:O-acetylhomoserine (thiol)-lyase|nr:PLP-dependent transferase [Prevotellaceae bacterium]
MKDTGFSTRIIVTKYAKPDAHGAINFPIYKTAAFEYDTAEHIAAAFQNKLAGHTYSRITNPTIAEFEQKLKAASGAENAMVLASGMAAISNAFLTVAYAGANIVSSPRLFGNTFSILKFTLEAFGVETRFVDTDNLDEIAAAIDENTCAFFCELITNPHLEIADLPEISKILRAKNVPMIVDTTVVPPCGFDARAAGVDIEVLSTTKYISGGATSIGGAILDYGTFDWGKNKKLAALPVANPLKFMFKLRMEIARNIGACAAPDTAYMQSLGLETLELRYKAMSRSAYELAKHFSAHPKVVKANYPTLETSPYKAIADKLFRDNLAGAMFTLHLESKAACYQFLNNLQIIRRATNMFDNKTLAIHPESTIYGTFSAEMKQVIGVEDTLIRFSVGLENVADLKADIEKALV